MSGRKIGLVELLTRIGDDQIKFQNLDTCWIDAKWDRKKGTKITFGTDEPLGPNGTEPLGLVVWLPRDEVRRILASPASAESAGGTDG